MLSTARCLGRLSAAQAAASAATAVAALRKKSTFSALDVPLTEPWPGLGQVKYSEIDSAHMPATSVTTLPSGLKIASEDTPGAFATLGVVVDTGTRYERPGQHGVSHLLDRMSYKSTKKRSRRQLIAELERLGGNALSQGSRETMMYYASVFSQDVEAAVDILGDVVQNSLVLEDELEEQRTLVRYEIMEMLSKPDRVVPELVHQAAYHNNTLGYPLVCPEDMIEKITPDMLREYMAENFVGPRMVLAAAGVDHDYLVELAHKYFKDVPAHPPCPAPERQKAQYTGGRIQLHVDTTLPEQPEKEKLLHITVALEGVSWIEDDIYAATTLQMMMGGGGSFSAGGPGKGMYSRLYSRVLNSNGFLESCTAFNTCYMDSGLFGISTSTPAKKSRQTMDIIRQQLYGMMEAIEPRELMRAKNQLKSSLLMNLESNAVLMEDIAKQVLTAGKRLQAHELCANIDKVTANDIHRVATRILKSPPTVVIYGDLVEGEADKLQF
eukprot:comp24185_c0_seq1/m.44310 comp24185_c0_seq1/g.44310  ORF comp24185_c0_seq1/g.44310 comp24185_c0_seq1/m.44310 type:complete len:496 (-) comp24185_c0_seq1:132-1619(-)